MRPSFCLDPQGGNPMNGYTEDHLIEQPAIQLMQHELGWDTVNEYFFTWPR